MIGELPTSLTVDGEEYPIRTDFRVALIIFEAYNNPDLSDFIKNKICLECLFIDIPVNINAALERANWFLDGGDAPKSKPLPVKVIDWEQDQYLIFPELNKAAGFNVRAAEYLHWWDVLGFMGIIGDGLYAQVMNIRIKRARGKKLEKWEREFYNTHKELIHIRERLSQEEQAQLDAEENFIESLI